MVSGASQKAGHSADPPWLAIAPPHSPPPQSCSGDVCPGLWCMLSRWILAVTWKWESIREQYGFYSTPAASFLPPSCLHPYGACWQFRTSQCNQGVLVVFIYLFSSFLHCIYKLFSLVVIYVVSFGSKFVTATWRKRHPGSHRSPCHAIRIGAWSIKP